MGSRSRRDMNRWQTKETCRSEVDDVKEWFKARNVWAGAFAALTDEEAGRLAKALWTYTTTGEQSELSGNEKGCFAMIVFTLQQDESESGTLSEKRRSAGSKGGLQKAANQANATFATESVANRANANNKIKNKEKEEDIKESPLKGTKEKEEAKASAAALDRSFDKFWACYPRHTAKQDAKRAFLKISPDDTLLNTMLTAIQRQKQTEQWSDPRYVPHPATWLNGRRWEDEPAAPRAAPGKTVSAARYSQRDYDEADLEERLGVNDLFRGAS